jgi:hypothetical protein
MLTIIWGQGAQYTIKSVLLCYFRLPEVDANTPTNRRFYYSSFKKEFCLKIIHLRVCTNVFLCPKTLDFSLIPLSKYTAIRLEVINAHAKSKIFIIAVPYNVFFL